MALWFLDQGLTLIRLRPRSKAPWTPMRTWVTTTNPEVLTGWFVDDPGLNLGVVCSPETRTAIVDADTYKGLEGSIEGLDLPETLTTAGRGTQYIYRTDGRPTCTHAPGRRFVQVLGSALQYGAIPPSVHPGDRDTPADPENPLDPFPYEIVHKVAPVSAPEWLYEIPAWTVTSTDSPGEPTAPETAPEAPVSLCDEPRLLRERAKVRDLLEGVEAEGPWDQRHRRDFALAIACVRAQITERAWADVVRSLPKSKGREGGPKAGDAYLARTWSRATEMAASTPFIAAEVPVALLDWQARVDVLDGIPARTRRVLQAVADMAVDLRSETISVPNRVLRELTGIHSGKPISEALWWAEQRQILRTVGNAGGGLGRQVQLMPIPDKLISRTPARGTARTRLNLATVLASRANILTQYSTYTGGRATSPVPGREGDDEEDQVLFPSDTATGGGEQMVVGIGPLSATPSPHHVSSGSPMTPLPGTSFRWRIPVDHTAFHRAALGKSCADVLVALADARATSTTLAGRVSTVSRSTLFRALRRLETEGIVKKYPDATWAIDTLEPLDAIATRSGTNGSSQRLSMAIAMERDERHEQLDENVFRVEPSASPEPRPAPSGTTPSELPPDGLFASRYASIEDIRTDTVTYQRNLADMKAASRKVKRGAAAARARAAKKQSPTQVP